MRVPPCTSRRAALAMLVALLATPRHAEAHALEPRTPVDWTGAPCMTTIDRSRSGPIVALEYAIPFEDTALTENEPLDGRRHQFFALCRDHYFEDVMPAWISEADLAVALELGLGDASLVDLEHDVLDNAARWQGCATRITADDERRPISFEAAAEPVVWDTSALPAGAWVIEAYTWDPWFSLWTEHPGVFRLVDDPDPAANSPAAALTYAEQLVHVDEPARIGGCVEAMPGSTMSLAWARGGSGVDPQWHAFAQDVPVESGGFELDLPGPASEGGHYLLVALEVVDPLGRRWTAHGREYIGVVADPIAGDESETDTDESESDETGPPASEATDAGCGCSTNSPPSHGVIGIAISLLVGRRRRVASAIR
ncbi:hypothetical protein ACNOYE_17340 [Nannocystaceae bacterium ST9]